MSMKSPSHWVAYPNLVTTKFETPQCNHVTEAGYLGYSILNEIDCFDSLEMPKRIWNCTQEVERKVQDTLNRKSPH